MLLALLVPRAVLMQKGLQPFYRLFLPGRIHFLVTAIAGGIVSSGVIAEAIGDGFDQGGALAGMSLVEGVTHCIQHRRHIITVNLKTFDARGDGLLGNGGSAGLDGARYRYRPLVIVDHDHHRQLPGTGQIERLVKITA